MISITILWSRHEKLNAIVFMVITQIRKCLALIGKCSFFLCRLWNSTTLTRQIKFSIIGNSDIFELGLVTSFPISFKSRTDSLYLQGGILNQFGEA